MGGEGRRDKKLKEESSLRQAEWAEAAGTPTGGAKLGIKVFLVPPSHARAHTYTHTPSYLHRH